MRLFIDPSITQLSLQVRPAFFPHTNENDEHQDGENKPRVRCANGFVELEQHATEPVDQRQFGKLQHESHWKECQWCVQGSLNPVTWKWFAPIFTSQTV